MTEIRRGNPESRRIEGYAAVYDTPSKLFYGEWDEVLVRGAIDDECIKGSIVLALMNHDVARGVLARSKKGEGSLELRTDDKGLYFAFDVPSTALGDELLECVTRGDIDSCSFAFRVKDCNWEERTENGKTLYRRFITKIEELFDVSPVYNPAYDDTSIAKRNFDEVRATKSQTNNSNNRICYSEYRKNFY